MENKIEINKITHTEIAIVDGNIYTAPNNKQQEFHVFFRQNRKNSQTTEKAERTKNRKRNEKCQLCIVAKIFRWFDADCNVWVVMFVYSILFVFFRLRFLFIVIKKNEKKEKKRKCVRIMHTYDYFCCWEQCEMGTCVVCVDSTLSTAKTKINNNFQEYNCTGCLNVSEWVWKKWFSFFVCLFSKFQWRLRLICDADENFIQPILFFGTFLSVDGFDFFLCLQFFFLSPPVVNFKLFPAKNSSCKYPNPKCAWINANLERCSLEVEKHTFATNLYSTRQIKVCVFGT